jgi:hypothetical protein
MHLQQTKRGSRDSGGPQYYFHGLTPSIKKHLRKHGIVQVALVTPYGATKSDYLAVSKDRKLDSKMRPVAGSVGHDRIQQGAAGESIGESIRKWYNLPPGDFEKIAVDIEIRDEAFYVTPLEYKYASSAKVRSFKRADRPLTFTLDYRSPFWISQIAYVDRRVPGIVWWSIEEIQRIVSDHRKETKLPHIQETDILRASGPLRHLGMSLGGYVGKGYDCKTEFQFLDLPSYWVPVELKRNSTGFQYQQQKYGKDELSRAVLLCATHGHKSLPAHIDVVELEALAKFSPMDLRIPR